MTKGKGFVGKGETVDVSVLRDFVVLAESQNFTKAAAEVNMTQSNLSKRVSSLEKELGFKLLERDTRRVALTKAGASFYASLIGVLKALDEGIQSARETDSSSKPVISLGGNYANTRILSLAETASSTAANANLPFRVSIDRTFMLADPLAPEYIDPLEGILNRMNDIFLTFASESLYSLDREIIPLYRDPFAVFLSIESGFTHKQQVKLAELESFAFVETASYETYNRRIDEVCGALGIAPRRPRRYYDSMSSMGERCGDDEAIIVPASIAYRIPGPEFSGMVRVRPIEPNAYFEIVAVCDADSEKREHIIQCCALLKSIASDYSD